MSGTIPPQTSGQGVGMVMISRVAGSPLQAPYVQVLWRGPYVCTCKLLTKAEANSIAFSDTEKNKRFPQQQPVRNLRYANFRWHFDNFRISTIFVGL